MPAPWTRRRAMTLIEIIIVIAIMATLTALVVTGLVPSAEQARMRATATLLEKIDMSLQNKLDKFASLRFTNRTTRRDEYVKLFPEDFDDADPDIAAPRPGNHQANTESAECLYWIVVTSTSLGGALGRDNFTDVEIADTDDDGLFEFVDRWGKPIRFARRTLASGSVPDRFLPPVMASAGPDGDFSDDTTYQTAGIPYWRCEDHPTVVHEGPGGACQEDVAGSPCGKPYRMIWNDGSEWKTDGAGLDNITNHHQP